MLNEGSVLAWCTGSAVVDGLLGVWIERLAGGPEC
jgi:hypothetical protein